MIVCFPFCYLLEGLSVFMTFFFKFSNNAEGYHVVMKSPTSSTVTRCNSLATSLKSSTADSTPGSTANRNIRTSLDRMDVRSCFRVDDRTNNDQDLTRDIEELERRIDNILNQV